MFRNVTLLFRQMEAQLNQVVSEYYKAGNSVPVDALLEVVRKHMNQIPVKDVEQGNQFVRKVLDWLQDRNGLIYGDEEFNKEDFLAGLYLMGLRHFQSRRFNFIGGDDGGCNSCMIPFANCDFVMVPDFVQALMTRVGVLRN